MGQPERLPDLRTYATFSPSRSGGRQLVAGCACALTRKGSGLRGFDVNTLTVVARESYEEFAENLQHEIAEDTGIRFGIVAPDQFAAIPVLGEDGQTRALGLEPSKALWEYLKGEGVYRRAGTDTRGAPTGAQG